MNRNEEQYVANMRKRITALEDELARVRHEVDCRTMDCERYKECVFIASRLVRGVLCNVDETNDGEAFNLRVTPGELSALRSFIDDPVKK